MGSLSQIKQIRATHVERLVLSTSNAARRWTFLQGIDNLGT
jgi:hypothetical protein